MSSSTPDILDILIIGGGITGAAAARDAAGRGLSVVLCEKGDIASGTTSRSSRMVHGGLRYLERAQLKLVFESLHERNRLFRAAPDLVRRERFLLPVKEGRKKWYIGAGLLLYDLLSLSHDTRIESDGFSYVDGLCRPENLAVRMAEEAAGLGAEILTYDAISAISRDGICKTASGQEFAPRAILLSAGPWTDQLLASFGIPFPQPLLQPTRGTHLLMTTPIENPRLLQASSDGRVFFAIPCFGGTLVGTTDLDDDSDPSTVRPFEKEIDYLLREVRRHLPELGDSFRGAWTGIRPLLRGAGSADPGARSRGDLVMSHPLLPNLVIVVGGKLTTMRLMAERAISFIEQKFLGRRPRPWTADAQVLSSGARSTAFAVTLADVMLRRTYSGFASDPSFVRLECDRVAKEMGWSSDEKARQLANFKREAFDSFGLTIA